MWVDKLIIWAGENKFKIYSFECILHAIVGISLMYFSYQIGSKHISLLQDGVRAQGRIVEYKKEVFITTSAGSNKTTQYGTIMMPIIEFNNKGRVFRFKDWIGSDASYKPGEIVPIIYKATDPAVALIDRPVLNWMLWAPICVAGLFLLLVSVKNWLKHSLQK